MTTETLTPRQQRERDFYNSYSQGHCDTLVDLNPILGKERRPWNPYWYFFEIVQRRFQPGFRLLDFGCGWGSNTIVFCKMGYQVDAFDIAEGNLELAKKLAAEHGVSQQVSFHLMSAERLEFPDNSFDVVTGIDVLHHVNVESALQECRRVLKPGGVAFFREPVSNVLFDGIRNTRLVKKLVPNHASLDKHITEDERKLDANDLRAIRRVFPSHSFDRFRILARLGALIPSWEIAMEKLDWRLRILPGYHKLCGTVVMTLENEKS